MKNHYTIGRVSLFFALVINLLITASLAVAQTSEFTHQGKFPETGGTASGNYQMEFKLFDASTGGTQIGTTISIASVPVTKSVFSVNLDFGAAAFPGADRFLEIAARKTTAEPFAILGPRQKITSAPYSIKSKSAETAAFATAAINADSATRATTAINALQLGGLGANRYVRFDDNDNVGIGTTSTGSKLAVAGMIESTSGGIKFPDATTQTTAGITSVNTNATLTGDGSVASPLGVASPLMVRDLDHPTRQPFSAKVDDVGFVVYIPEGKRLVIETVTGRVGTVTGIPVDAVHFAVLAGSAEVFKSSFYIAPSFIRQTTGGNIAYYTHSGRIYLVAGDRLRISFILSETREIWLSGYWVDVP